MNISICMTYRYCMSPVEYLILPLITVLYAILMSRTNIQMVTQFFPLALHPHLLVSKANQLYLRNICHTWSLLYIPSGLLLFWVLLSCLEYCRSIPTDPATARHAVTNSSTPCCQLNLLLQNLCSFPLPRMKL